ncbi:uncharacterized protein FIBRA_02959 [Fibroporia radiculosa]|uniref:Adenylate kinase isoenzyme 6 homolog n=1 Tax=Fibroporia radiculosa TaxID=599839 RepID=J4G3L8_9APHY|nr:uncharacterized protein FIBRA_02959 [Fibroporia radiculosa]CCM00913.1 predicted protein [Fibroporia radiculosa]
MGKSSEELDQTLKGDGRQPDVAHDISPFMAPPRGSPALRSAPSSIAGVSRPLLPPSMPPARARAPVVVLTGTPGTGKTTHAQLLQQASPVPLQHINVGDWVKDKGLYQDYDDEWQSYTVDEDKLLDELEPLAAAGGIILDWHTSDIFPERWPDLVVVLRCDHSKLWDRLEKRGYPLKKIQENNEAEIMEVVLDEVRSSYPPEIVVELQSETTDDLEANVARIVQWIEAWREDHDTSDQ